MKKVLLVVLRLSVVAWLGLPIVFGLLLWNNQGHALFHAMFDDRGHRGFDAGDEAHRKVLMDAFAEAGMGIVGRFKADAADQVLLDDGETVLAIIDKTMVANNVAGDFISLPVAPERIRALSDTIIKSFGTLGDEVVAWEREVATAEGQFTFSFIQSDELGFLIVLRPPTSVLGQPDWIPLEPPRRIARR